MLYIDYKGEIMYKDDYTLEDYNQVTDECSMRIKAHLQKRYEELEEEHDAINDYYPYEDLYLKWAEVDDEEYLIRFLLKSLDQGAIELKAKRQKEFLELKRISPQNQDMIVDNNERIIKDDKTCICDSIKVTKSKLSRKELVYTHSTYHEKWDSFTKKLRRLTNENPSLPVVVSPQSFDSDSSIDCAIAYVHEKLTGEPKEKIILIHNVDDNHLDKISDDIDIPF